MQNRKEYEVWQACDALSKQGKRITYQAVGQELVALGYRRGSNSDICRYLATWKLKEDNLLNSQESTPPSNSNMNEFEEIIDAIRLEAEERTAEAEHQLLLLQEKNAALEAQLENNSTQTNNPFALMDISSWKANVLDRKQLIKLYQHHLTQVDTLYSALAKSRAINKKLMALIEI